MIYFTLIKFDKMIYQQVVGFSATTYRYIQADNENEAKGKAREYYKAKYNLNITRFCAKKAINQNPKMLVF